MRRNFLPESLLFFVAAALYSPIILAASVNSTSWTAHRKLVARYVVLGYNLTTIHKDIGREKTRELWYHGFDNYMTYGQPVGS
jgi:hypothetical protein